MSSNGHRTAIRTCPLCEATCGLEIELEGDRVASIRGDREDVFSHGFICPKGFALKELHEDPDRVRTPLIRRPDGSFAPASWDEAFAEIHRRLSPILAEDRNGVAVYLGNPNAHNLANMLYGKVLLRALSSRNTYSASTVDQRMGTVQLRAEFANPSGKWLPGQFAKVRILAGEQKAILVPQQAILQNDQSRIVMTVGADGKAQVRPVKIGNWIGSNTVVTAGLNDGDLVIVDNLVKVRAGTPVQAREQGAAPATSTEPAPVKTSQR